MRLLFVSTVLAVLFGVTMINAQESMPKTQRQIWIDMGDDAFKWCYYGKATACYLRAGLEE
jgi:hypothetical protein